MSDGFSSGEHCWMAGETVYNRRKRLNVIKENGNGSIDVSTMVDFSPDGCLSDGFCGDGSGVVA